MLGKILFIGFVMAFPLFAEIQEGLYILPSEKTMQLSLKDGTYRVRYEDAQGNRVVLQEGEYRVDGDRIRFIPKVDRLKEMGFQEEGLEEGEILGVCRLRWGGDIFVKKGCTEVSDEMSENENFKEITEENGEDENQITPPENIETESEDSSEQETGTIEKPWRIVRNGGFELSLPEGAKLRTDQKGFELLWNGAQGAVQIVPGGEVPSRLQRLLRECRPVKFLARGATRIALCKQGAAQRYLEIVTKKSGEGTLYSFAAANDLKTLKRLSIALSSLRPVKRKGGSPNPGGVTLPTFTWSPSSRCYTVAAPRGWDVQGGCANLGRNGYIMLLKMTDPERKRGMLLIDYPFYQSIRMGGQNLGVAPMDCRSYFGRRLFQDLASRYGILFPGMRLDRLGPDVEMSRRLTMETANFLRRYGIAATDQYRVCRGEGLFSPQETPLRLEILGVLAYRSRPLYGGAGMTLWGPEPAVITYAPQREITTWNAFLLKLAETWRPDPRWLARHHQYAAQDARSVLAHFQKIRQIIQEHETAMEQAAAEHDRQEHFENELFWDTFYALGGEDRYDDPDTGEEIDVPTGADKYLYDQYSQTWVGLHDDQPDVQELEEALREKGFRELVPHRY
ncbi:hypothetical protein [Nitratifractor sp.]